MLHNQAATFFFFFMQLKSVGLHIWQARLGFVQAHWSGWVPGALGPTVALREALPNEDV